MTLLLLCAGVALVAGGLGLALEGARRAPGTPAPARFASHPPDRPAVAPGPAGRPLATVAGSEPHTHLTLLALRRTGPKVVTATLRLTLDRGAPLVWTPRLEGPDGETGTAGGLRLVDEVNGREHLPLRDGEGGCLCSTGIDTPRSLGESVVVSAKLPAPPADVGHASLQVPGFASIDRVRIGA